MREHSPAPVRRATKDAHPGRAARLVALIPAHNEQDRVAHAISGLRGQATPPDRIIVVADNCADATAQVARAASAEVLTTTGNRHRKAGALNQAIGAVLPTLADEDLLLVQDADTVLVTDFLAIATSTLADPRVGAVGGVFFGEPGGGVLGLLQRMEFHRYAWEVRRNGGRAMVLTGTATLFRVRVLREVRQARERARIGGGTGYYSLASLTEDDEITKAIKTLGYRTLSPAGCAVTTEVMPDLVKLWHQRARWQRGALENLRDYGWTRVTARYFRQQIMLGVGALSFVVYLAFLGILLGLGHWHGLSLFWASIGMLFVVEKVVTVRAAGPKAVLVAVAMVPEMLYDLFQHCVYFSSLWGLVRRNEETWAST